MKTLSHRPLQPMLREQVGRCPYGIGRLLHARLALTCGAPNLLGGSIGQPAETAIALTLLNDSRHVTDGRRGAPQRTLADSATRNTSTQFDICSFARLPEKRPLAGVTSVTRRRDIRDVSYCVSDTLRWQLSSDRIFCTTDVSQV